MISDELRSLEICVRENPDSADARLQYAHMLGIAGRLEDAREEYYHLLSRISPQHELYETARDGYVQMVCQTATRSSKKPLNRPDVLQSALDNHVRLQSLSEAVAAQLGDLKYAEKYQVVSTLALYYYDVEKSIAVAFAEIPTTLESRALLNAGHAMHRNGLELILPKNHPLVNELLTNAQKENRITPAPSTTELVLSTEQQNNISEYGSHSFVQACLGSSAIAEMNAHNLRNKDFNKGHVLSFANTTSELQSINDQNVIVQCIGLVSDFTIVGASYSVRGRVRGLVNVKKNSP